MIVGYTIQALSESWSYLDRAAFIALFDRVPHDANLPGLWWDSLAVSGLSIEEGYIQGRTKLPSISVELPPATRIHESLGNSYNSERMEFAMEMPVRVSIRAYPETSIVEGLMLATIAMLMSRKPWIMETLKCGNFYLSGVSGLAPERAMQPEKTQIVGRALTFSALFNWDLPVIGPTASTPDRISVHHYDSSDADGFPGRVTTEG